MSCVNASTKREIRQFHVEVVQRRQRNVQKKRDAKLLFCQSKPITFLPSLLPSPLPQLSIFDLLMTFRVFFLISYISNRTAPRLFLVLYLSVRSSRSRALRYGLLNFHECQNYLGGGGGLGGGAPPPPPLMSYNP